MKIKNFVSLAVFAVVLLSVPASTYAYFTTTQSAMRINEDTIMYTVSYRFGSDSYGFLMPIAALQNDTKTNFTNYAEYTLFNGSEESKNISSNALVFSNAKIENNQYFIPKGESSLFTLVSLVTLPKEAKENLDELSLQVTKLPFMLVEGKKEIKNGLNPSELQYYKTPVIKF
jgi:hypothetical protein